MVVNRLLDKWHEARASMNGVRMFNTLPRSAKRFVFYAESAADWAFLSPVADVLRARGFRVICITSDRNDSVLADGDAFYVGSGGSRTVFFRAIDADGLVMTLTDLQTFHLKRSVYPVHYFYIFHSIASIHRVYRERAFDAYDTIMCVGPHHLQEMRRTEEVYGLKPKRLVEHGYGRLDTLMRDLASRKPAKRSSGEPLKVLVAPSWGESSMVRHCLDRLLQVLLADRFEVTLRLHPMTRRHYPRLADDLLRKYGQEGRFRFDPHINTTEALLDADIMISEWSGAPLEYAFARERPVIFIDTPPKVHNPNYKRIGLPCLEADIREKIGTVVPLGHLERVPTVVRELVGGARQWAGRIRAVRDATVFNVGRSGEVGAEAIAQTLEELRQSKAGSGRTDISVKSEEI